MKKAIVVLSALFILLNASVAFSQLDERYHTYQEVLDTLTALELTYPEIMFVDTMGYSTRDNIPMLRVKLSDNPQFDEDEPAIFYDGGVHADEVLSVEVVMEFIYDFTERYSQNDEDINTYLQELEIFVIPFVNPEGHLVVEGGDLAWRKNKSDNDTNGVFDMYDGVDNNRNYDFGWDIDDNSDAVAPESLQFKGWAPFTESENLAMAAMGWKYRPIIALDHHSPTYGRPNVAYYPWYWYPNEGGNGFGPDEDFMHDLCDAYTSMILAIPDTTGNPSGMYEARRALVNKGDFKTYFYGNFGTAAFSVEISDTTIQDPALVDSITTHHMPGLYYLLDRALYGRITGVVRDSVTLEPIEAEVQVTQHINDDINPRLTRPDYGRYNRLLAPGSYTLKFLKDGYRTKTISGVPVNNISPTITDVFLYPNNPRPPAPVLTFPTAGVVLDTNMFSFEWEEPIFAESYIIEIALDSDFTELVLLDSSLTENYFELITALPDSDYYWRIKAGNDNGWGPYSEVQVFTVDALVGVDDEGTGALPSGTKLYQNHPNPFNATTKIYFALSEQSLVRLEIFDIGGRLVNTIIDGYYQAGNHSITWNGTNSSGEVLSSGVYLYKLEAAGKVEAKRLVLIK